MGNLSGRAEHTPKMLRGSNDIVERDHFDVHGPNGYLLGKQYVPEEVLTTILSYVSAKDLVFNCRRVCKTWCNVIDKEVWRAKLVGTNLRIQKLIELPWFAMYWILTKKFLDKNLVKNGCGEEDFNHWQILSNGGNQWCVERPPVGTLDFPRDNVNEEILRNNSCFATSYYSCSKKQTIDLTAEGAVPYFMQAVNPLITISEWYSGRWDCRSVYELKVTLFDEDEDELDSFEIRKNVGGDNGSAWHQVVHVFENSAEVRYVEFYHAGMDSQFWQGHYGSKMTGASVILSLP